MGIFMGELFLYQRVTVYRMDTTIDYQTLCSLVQPLNSCTLASAPTKQQQLSQQT